MGKPRELMFSMIKEPEGFSMVYDHVKSTAFHNNEKWGFDDRHHYIEKSAADKLADGYEELYDFAVRKMGKTILLSNLDEALKDYRDTTND